MEQLDFPFLLDQDKLSEFLTRWLTIEDEEDRLREDKRLLKEAYADDFPMRGILTAVKVIRARTKLAEHPRDGIKHAHQRVLEALVETHLRSLKEETRQVPEMTGTAD